LIAALFFERVFGEHFGKTVLPLAIVSKPHHLFLSEAQNFNPTITGDISSWQCHGSDLHLGSSPFLFAYFN